MDDIKLFAKNEKQLETLLNALEYTVRAYGWNLASKNAPYVMKSGKRYFTDGME